MDIETYGMLKNKVKRADEAAQAAEQAAADANEASQLIYHDKNFMLSVNDDNSLTLAYKKEEE